VGTKNAWTPERRARQAEIIRNTKPWLSSTGPRTGVGKAVSSRNATMCAEIKQLRAKLAETRAHVLALYGMRRMPKRPKLPPTCALRHEEDA
jgi:hypothetical protein